MKQPASEDLSKLEKCFKYTRSYTLSSIQSRFSRKAQAKLWSFLSTDPYIFLILKHSKHLSQALRPHVTKGTMRTLFPNSCCHIFFLNNSQTARLLPELLCNLSPATLDTYFVYPEAKAIILQFMKSNRNHVHAMPPLPAFSHSSKCINLGQGRTQPARPGRWINLQIPFQIILFVFRSDS